jgi:hypothetical protein
LHLVVFASVGNGQNGGGLTAFDGPPAGEDAGGLVFGAVLE